MPQDLAALPSGVAASFPGRLLFLSGESLAHDSREAAAGGESQRQCPGVPGAPGTCSVCAACSLPPSCPEMPRIACEPSRQRPPISRTRVG